MRYMAIDLGGKRTGIAVGDDESGIVSPERAIEIPLAQRERLVDALVDAIEEFGVDAVVVGLPLDMDGGEGDAAKRVREFAVGLTSRSEIEMHFQDERLTSAAADWNMAQSGLTHAQKKRRRDALAAAAILRDFLDQNRQ